MSNRKTLFILRRPPYGSSLAREALEAVLAAGSFEQQISVLFIDDGVLQLINNQQPEGIAHKNHGAMLQVLPLYDVEQIYADQHSLSARHLSSDDIINSANIADTTTVQQLLTSHDHILSF